MAKILALELARDIDLSRFIVFLNQAGIAHRVHESGEHQLLWVNTPEQKAAVLQAYFHFQRGELPTVSTGLEPKSHSGAVSAALFPIFSAALRSPLTMTLIVANLLCFPATFGIDEGTLGPWLRTLTFLDFHEIGGKLYFADLNYTLESGQIWRLVTPMLLHFGLLHIVFNLLWVWEIGRRIEVVNGAGWLMALVFTSSLAANLTQYYLSGPGLFGGMSGVVFGLLGFSFIWSRLVPLKGHGLPKGIFIFMLVFLVVGFSGAIDLLGLGSLANGAHLGGLIAGVLLGLLAFGMTQVLSEKQAR